MEHYAPVTESPARLGRYAVRRRLGSGAFATVWLAYDEQLGCPVAVKVLAENWADDGEVHRRFLEEGRFLRRVESPYVVPVYDAGELPDGRPYLVMAFADQGTLADRVVAGPSPPPSRSRPGRRSRCCARSGGGCRRCTTAGSCTAT